jgi:hypothetical protein
MTAELDPLSRLQIRQGWTKTPWLARHVHCCPCIETRTFHAVYEDIDDRLVEAEQVHKMRVRQSKEIASTVGDED